MFPKSLLRFIVIVTAFVSLQVTNVSIPLGNCESENYEKR